MTPDEASAVDPALRGAAMWVRHRDEVHLLPVCSGTRPYSTAALRRVLEDWEPGDPVAAQRVVLDDDSVAVVVGCGLRDDPMFCAAMEDRPLPECDCADRDDCLDALDDGYLDGVPVVRRPRRMVTVYLPGDGPV